MNRTIHGDHPKKLGYHLYMVNYIYFLLVEPQPVINMSIEMTHVSRVEHVQAQHRNQQLGPSRGCPGSAVLLACGKHSWPLIPFSYCSNLNMYAYCIGSHCWQLVSVITMLHHFWRLLFGKCTHILVYNFPSIIPVKTHDKQISNAIFTYCCINGYYQYHYADYYLTLHVSNFTSIHGEPTYKHVYVDICVYIQCTYI